VRAETEEASVDIEKYVEEIKEKVCIPDHS